MRGSACLAVRIIGQVTPNNEALRGCHVSRNHPRGRRRAAGQVKTMSTYDPDSDQLHEECGIFGVWAPDRDVARLTYFLVCARCSIAAGNRRESPWVMAARLWFAKTGTARSRVLQRRLVDALRPAGRGPRALWHRRPKSWEASQPHLLPSIASLSRLRTTVPSSTPTSCAAS